MREILILVLVTTAGCAGRAATCPRDVSPIDHFDSADLVAPTSLTIARSAGEVRAAVARSHLDAPAAGALEHYIASVDLLAHDVALVRVPVRVHEPGYGAGPMSSTSRRSREASIHGRRVTIVYAPGCPSCGGGDPGSQVNYADGLALVVVPKGATVTTQQCGACMACPSGPIP